MALCGLLGLQGGYPLALCGLLGLQGGYPSQLRASARRVSHKLPKMVRFPKLPYKEFISAVAGSIFQFLALWTLIFFILALRAFISCYFAFLGFILAFGPLIWLWGFAFGILGLEGGVFCGLSGLLGLQGGYPLALCGLLSLQGGHPSQLRASARRVPPQVAKNCPFSKAPIQRIYQRRGRVNFQNFGLLGLDFLHFGFVGFHFLSFWLSGPSF